jgi:hypothetical protein
MISSYQCDYLGRHAVLPALMSERDELAHIDGKLRSLDQHISQLTTSRHALLLRSRQLQNSLLPVHNLPVEILSLIFKHLVNALCGKDSDSDYQYRTRLRQAFVLGSVSSHFRHVAFTTPELWRRICLKIINIEAIGRALSLLQHCIALSPSVDICVSEVPFDEEEARSALDILLTQDTTRKIKFFEICSSFHPPDLWTDKFKKVSFPMLDTLSIRLEYSEPLLLDIQALTNMTRLIIYAPWEEHSIIVPPSIQYLSTRYILEEALVPLLYRCPNLIECDITDFADYEDLDADILFTRPLILPYLKRLSSPGINVFTSSSCVENIHLPSLEFLDLQCLEINRFDGPLLLCRNVAATLTTLALTIFSGEPESNVLSQLCRISFPKLKKMTIHCKCWAPLLPHVLDLLEVEDGCHNFKPYRFPALESFIWECTTDAEPHHLLDLLREPKVGKAFYFHIWLHFFRNRQSYQSTPGLLEELRTIISGRQIEVAFGKYEIRGLGVQDNSWGNDASSFVR